MHLEQLKGLLDEVSEVVSLSLTVVNLVTDVEVLGLEQVHDGKDLSVVRHQSLSNSVRAGYESLEDLKGDGNNLGVSGVESGFDRNNKLGADGEDLGSALLEHVEHTLDGKESVGVNLLSNSLEEDGEVVMVVELLDLDLPVDFVLGSVVNCNWQISSVVEKSELTYGDGPASNGSGDRLFRNGLGLRLVETGALSSESDSLLEGVSSLGCH